MSAPKFSLSRRAALTAIAGAAAGSALPPAMTPAAGATVPAELPAATAATVSSTSAESAARPPGFRVPVLIDPADPWHYAPHPAGPLTTRTITGGLEVSDGTGVIATLTTGARTVTLRGARRWFTEQKKAVHDAFVRTPPTGGWGMSPGGGTWSHHNGADADYFVESGRAAITLSAGKSRYSLLPDHGIGDIYAAARFSFDKLPVGAPVSLGLVFGARDVNNHYRARLVVTPAGDVQLVLEKEIDDAPTTLSAAVTVGAGFKAFDHWWVRVEKAGDILRARAWKHLTTGTDDEPTVWHHSVRDPEKAPDAVFRSGTAGVRGLASTGATVLPQARVYDFSIEAATWTDPPVVTHDTWVRVLPEPFDGTWTAAVEQRIRAWAGDTSPDALTYSSMYRPYAPAVTYPAHQNAQVLGESGYSKPLPSGLREVGADFHEYMGLTWAFDSGENVTQAPDPKWLKNLDCSGFVRMVYGYHLGVPMSLAEDSVERRYLPRRSEWQAASSPGIVVAQATDAPPSLDTLRIGDVLFWNDPDDGAVSHTGIYMGLDQHGKRRFVSSRKTPNGPTMADLGGKSIIDGTASDLYTDKLRVIRRL
ncbi:NlpC/P60 family protein [Streptomyces sp. AC550_RSS872]|uniref:NlpC/P60 family protein n=1 Tax=Streptomyces sp. AC550_RSS872 TaxID=2823689 RepID=UPI001C26E65C|nr:NlpC/P60 family protein [Streptomyces sp. AC550_RSS872]